MRFHSYAKLALPLPVASFPPSCGCPKMEGLGRCHALCQQKVAPGKCPGLDFQALGAPGKGLWLGWEMSDEVFALRMWRSVWLGVTGTVGWAQGLGRGLAESCWEWVPGTHCQTGAGMQWGAWDCTGKLEVPEHGRPGGGWTEAVVGWQVGRVQALLASCHTCQPES